MKKFFFAIALIAFTLSGCKKDKDEVCELSAASLAGTYKITGAKYKASASAPEIDEFATWDACEKDDLVIFNSNSNYTFQDAGVACTPPGGENGIWGLSGTTLNIDGDTFTVSSFDCNGMVLSENSIGVLGATYTLYFTKQ